jgi:hypothetical protein
MNDSNQTPPQNISFGKLLMSVLSAFFGVQSNANRQRDFSSGKLSHFIIIGLMLGLAFIFIVIGVVQIVMKLAGA